jgi:peptidoglycan hydrolase CwlO-like protein
MVDLQRFDEEYKTLQYDDIQTEIDFYKSRVGEWLENINTTDAEWTKMKTEILEEKDRIIQLILNSPISAF